VKEEVQEEELNPNHSWLLKNANVPAEIGMLQYIAEHTNYPEVAKENNIQEE
jgi:hypothetical protein